MSLMGLTDNHDMFPHLRTASFRMRLGRQRQQKGVMEGALV
jgi:hypothetical protein